MPLSALLLLLCIPNPGLPPVELDDALRFGATREQVFARWAFNRECRRRAEEYWLVNPAWRPQWDAVLTDLDRRGAAWDLLDDAFREHLDDERRLLALVRLREMLGAEAYYAGVMPCHVDSAWMRELE